MRRPDPAIARRDDLLARTRRLSLLVAGGASGRVDRAWRRCSACRFPARPPPPGRRPRPARARPRPPATGRPGRPRHHANHGHGARHGHRHRRLAPPTQAPSTPARRVQGPADHLVRWLVTTAHVLWYLTRATGLVALVLLTATIVLGIIGTARAASPRWPRLLTAGLHRNLALTSTGLVAVHVVTTVTDPFVSISLVAAFVPFASDLPADLAEPRRARLRPDARGADYQPDQGPASHRAWRAVHLLVYVCWPVALWHGLGTGTDTKLIWVLAINPGCVIAVARRGLVAAVADRQQAVRLAGRLTPRRGDRCHRDLRARRAAAAGLVGARGHPAGAARARRGVATWSLA